MTGLSNKEVLPGAVGERIGILKQAGCGPRGWVCGGGTGGRGKRWVWIKGDGDRGVLVCLYRSTLACEQGHSI